MPRHAVNSCALFLRRTLGNVEMALSDLNHRELIYAIDIVQYLTSGDELTTFREGRINMDS